MHTTSGKGRLKVTEHAGSGTKRVLHIMSHNISFTTLNSGTPDD
jgi:hypothetical protein